MLSSFTSKDYPLTKWLIIANVTVYVILAFLSGNIFVITTPYLIFVAQYNLLTMNGLFYELFTSLFVHFNIVHLGFNMFFLYLLGTQLEMIFAKKDYLITYFGGGLLGNILTLFIYPSATLSGGASGAIFSIYAFAITVFYKLQRKSMRTIISLLVFMLIINSGFGANIIAHFGGALFGFLYGIYFLKLRTRLYKPTTEYYYEYRF